MQTEFRTYAKIAAARCPRFIPGELTSIFSNFCFDFKKIVDDLRLVREYTSY